MTSSFVKAILFAAALPACAQVYSPRVLKAGQPDATDLHRFVQSIYDDAHAATPRQKAEAIWRFFLTDGRFVPPGFWYHIAGWAYEEPKGEVLDATKLLNSYGFGLCYHIAPLLEAMFDAGGFEHSRVWFLTGHTVAEVFYEGRYHYYDSDEMAYTTLGKGPPRQSVVASVRDIERDGTVITSRLSSPKKANAALVEEPWYPADVREAAVGGIAELFTTTADNHLFAFRRYAVGHSMQFVLRPGERMIRYYRPEDPGLFYLPYKFDGKTWTEFPQAVASYAIRTEDGPHSQKDARLWATGRIEYEPDLTGAPAQFDIEMPSPYVVIDAAAEMQLKLAAGQTLVASTSVDGGRTWQEAGRAAGPWSGKWRTEAATLTRSEHGRRTAVSGSYGYLLRLARSGGGDISSLRITTRFELNPRTLPDLQIGDNRIEYAAGPRERWHPLHVDLAHLDSYAASTENTDYVEEAGQGFLTPKSDGDAVLLFEVPARGGSSLLGFSAGGRFLDLRDGLMPDKLTAEVRTTAHAFPRAAEPAASIEWSTSRDGPFTPLWTYRPEVKWRDNDPVDRLLRWPEVDETVRTVPQGVPRVWVRYRLRGMALDDIRLSAIEPGQGVSPLTITHVWTQAGKRYEHTEAVRAGADSKQYDVAIPGPAPVQNDELVISCPR